MEVEPVAAQGPAEEPAQVQLAVQRPALAVRLKVRRVLRAPRAPCVALKERIPAGLTWARSPVKLAGAPRALERTLATLFRPRQEFEPIRARVCALMLALEPGTT